MFGQNYYEKALDLFTGPITNPSDKKRHPRNRFKVLKEINKNFKYDGLEYEKISISNKEYSMKYFIGAVLDGRDRLQINGIEILTEYEKREFTNFFNYIDDVSYTKYISFYLTQLFQKDSEKWVRCPSCNNLIIDDSPTHTFWPCPNCNYTLTSNSRLPMHCRFEIGYGSY